VRRAKSAEPWPGAVSGGRRSTGGANRKRSRGARIRFSIPKIIAGEAEKRERDEVEPHRAAKQRAPAPPPAPPPKPRHIACDRHSRFPRGRHESRVPAAYLTTRSSCKASLKLTAGWLDAARRRLPVAAHRVEAGRRRRRWRGPCRGCGIEGRILPAVDRRVVELDRAETPRARGRSWNSPPGHDDSLPPYTPPRPMALRRVGILSRGGPQVGRGIIGLDEVDIGCCRSR